MKNVLVLSSTASAINYIKALRDQNDIKLFITDASRYASGLYAGHITPLVIPRAKDLLNYKSALEKIIDEKKIDALIPTSDYDVDGVMELLRQGWDPPVAMFKPDPEVHRVMFDKKEVNLKLKDLGFEVPRTYDDPSEASYPLVIKPACEAGAKGVFIVTDESELESRLTTLREGYGEHFVLQEYIPGGVGYTYVAALLYGNDGELYGEAASKSYLTVMTWGGGGNAGVMVDEPQLLGYSKKIIEALGGWRGPINLEFKKHPDQGHYYLMEINCRLHGYSYITTMNDMNFPRAVVDLLTKGTTEFLAMKKGAPRKNFIIGLRERIVDDWV